MSRRDQVIWLRLATAIVLIAGAAVLMGNPVPWVLWLGAVVLVTGVLLGSTMGGES